MPPEARKRTRTRTGDTHMQRLTHRRHRLAAVVSALAVVVGLTAALSAASASKATPLPDAAPAPAATDSGLAESLAQARLATAKYATNLERAKDDGYMVITPMIPNMGIHYLNPAIQGFDVTKPPILVYVKRD